MLAKTAEAAGKIYTPSATAGNTAYDEAVHRADLDASAARIALSRSENEQIIALQNEAIDAGVKGEASTDEQRQQAIDAVTRKYQAGEISKRA